VPCNSGYRHPCGGQPRAIACSTALAITLGATAAASAPVPQFNFALVPGAAWSHPRPPVAFFGTVHGDVLFGRAHNHDFGFGPSLDLATLAFQDVRFSPGLSVQLPRTAFDTVLSAGPQLRFNGSFEPSVAGRLFLGSRAFNTYGSYTSALGGVIGADVTWSPQPRVSIWLGLNIDAQWFAIPWLAIASWIHGPNR
jgi:hypothetical protein